jgi:hypothetical protein
MHTGFKGRKLGLVVAVAVVFSLLVLPQSAEAHPGNMASDGCHYCRTNCDSWGVAWNARHCHGGYAPAPQYVPPPTSTRVPTRRPLPTLAPTRKPTNSPTPSPIFSTSTPKPTLEVEDAQTGITPKLSFWARVLRFFGL